MKKLRLKTSLLVSASTMVGLAMGAGMALAAHPPVTLYTFEEVAAQYGMTKMPVMVDPVTRKGFPYSPKQTCGAAGCHIKNGVDYTYDKISDHAYHSAQGRNQYLDTVDGSGAFTGTYDASKPKPWVQSGAMFGKW